MVLKNHPPPRVMILFLRTPPQKKNRLPPQGGSGIPLSQKKPLFSFLPFLPVLACRLPEAIFGQTKTDFKNPREVFSQHGLKNKNLSQFFQRSYEQGESKTSSRPIFPDSQFSVTVPILQELLRPAGDEFGETEGGFCPEHAHIQ
jgi:hypothetical protein